MTEPLVTALRTLTILPIPGRDVGDFRKSLPWFAAAGLAIGLCVAVAAVVLQSCAVEIPLVNGILLCLFLTVLSGGLHVDGLADAADGFLGGRTRDDTLRILKDSRVGAFGVVAVVFDLLLKCALLDTLITSSAAPAIAMAVVLSRVMQAIVLASFPYARGSEGTAAPFSKGGQLLPILITEFVLLALLAGHVVGWAVALPASLAAAGAALTLCWYFHKRINGITGDCVGAANEVFEIVFLLVVALGQGV